MRRRTIGFGLVVLIAVAVGFLFTGSDDDSTIDDTAAQAEPKAVQEVPSSTTAVDIPTTTLLGPPTTLVASNAYKFADLQPNSDKPVAYDPCRVINVVVNDTDAKAGDAELFQSALNQISSATGLRFNVEGKTDERDSEERSAVQKDRYGDRYAPVLVEWSSAKKNSELKGDVAGYAYSDYADKTEGRIYVTGAIVLDELDIRDTVDEEGSKQATLIILHELGHLVGLDHVEDSSQLMNPEFDRQTGLGDGDKAGLARLGSGVCTK